jgi:dipeptidyl aminopeptidase/acylaminoacyl peptidase
MRGFLSSAHRTRPAGQSVTILALLALLLMLTPPGALAVPLSVYGHLPAVEDVSLSPDGSRIAYVRTEGDLRVVVIASVADRKMIRWVRAGGDKLRGIVWADDDNVMLYTSVTSSNFGFKSEWFMLRVYNVTRNEIRPLPGHVIGTLDAHVLDIVTGRVMVRRVDGHTVLFVPGENFSHGLALFRCDLTTGHTTMMTVGSFDTESWLVGRDGDLVAEQVYEEQGQRWAIRIYNGGAYREVASGHAMLEHPSFIGFGPTVDTLIVESIENGDRQWRLLSMKDGTFGEPMAEAAEFDEPIEDRLTHRFIGGEYVADIPQYVFFDPGMESRWKAIVSAFDGDNVRFISASGDFSKIVVLIDGARYGYRYELVNLENPSAISIGEVYAGIDRPLEVRRITYAAADGLQIPAYLTLPRGRDAHNLPLVVLPHGGPAARDTAEFDWWSQALAEQGYAVLQPNYRGSNLDWKFLEAGFGEWGRKMQTDLSDGVRYLTKQGIADAARVCIVGASYGGYAAMAGVALDPGVYRCAVSVAGLSDLAVLQRSESSGGIDNRSTNRYWDRFWGVTGRLDPALDAISPVKHVDAINVPVLLIHGRDDTVVPFEQSQILFDAMKRGKKDVELVTLKQEDHWLSRSDTRLQMLDATVTFLRAHNPPD